MVEGMVYLCTVTREPKTSNSFFPQQLNFSSKCYGIARFPPGNARAPRGVARTASQGLSQGMSPWNIAQHRQASRGTAAKQQYHFKKLCIHQIGFVLFLFQLALQPLYFLQFGPTVLLRGSGIEQTRRLHPLRKNKISAKRIRRCPAFPRVWTLRRMAQPHPSRNQILKLNCENVREPLGPSDNGKSR